MNRAERGPVSVRSTGTTGGYPLSWRLKRTVSYPLTAIAIHSTTKKKNTIYTGNLRFNPARRHRRSFPPTLHSVPPNMRGNCQDIISSMAVGEPSAQQTRWLWRYDTLSKSPLRPISSTLPFYSHTQEGNELVAAGTSQSGKAAADWEGRRELVT